MKGTFKEIELIKGKMAMHWWSQEGIVSKRKMRKGLVRHDKS